MAARRRITPIAVDQPVAPTLILGAEVALDVGPAPEHGDTKAIHATLGAGRRVWVDIQDTWQLKFKQVSIAQPLQLCIDKRQASQPAWSARPALASAAAVVLLHCRCCDSRAWTTAPGSMSRMSSTQHTTGAST